MKKFLNLFLLFALPILVVGCTMEFLLRHIPNQYQVKSDYLNTHQTSIKTLLVGSSHILYGVNPDFLTEEALNYGNVSQTIDIDYNIIHQNITKLDSLDTVVLRLSYTTLFEQLKAGDESWRIKNYTMYTDVNLDSKMKHHFEIFSVKLKYNLEQIYNFYILNETPEFVNASGWATNNSHYNLEKLEALSTLIAKKHTAKTDDLYADNCRYLDKIIQECDDKGIKIVLITTPAYRDYVDKLDSLQLEKTISVGVLMQNNYSNCLYFNFLKDKRFGRQDFIDVDHLNEQGAEKFSKVIDSILTQ
ncbi:hypothetical protein [Formosa sp. L2A11]|uniref:hypothetical protein n=1 Tax=Formosa sp. L2A11 TaxID=2686363 RepID=UPI00131B355D|nr:hypothetical protein [Formosa sp. L2A11]